MNIFSPRRTTFLVLLVLVIPLAGIAFWPVENAPTARRLSASGMPIGPAARSQYKVDYARLEQRIAALMHDRDMVGLAVGVIENGRISFVGGYGETLAHSGIPVTPDTVFRWASLSKGVASSVAVRLAEEGSLSLDTPIAGMGTTLTLPGGGERVVTMADLLAHRVGLVRNAWDDRLEGGQDPKALRAALNTLPPYCPPATCHAYQNVAYDAASEIVEQATGQPYADVVAARIFGPLGMTNASIGREGLQRAARWAQPHRHGKVPTVVNDAYYRVPAAGGVNSSILDLTRWMAAQMGGAPGVLSPAALDTLHRPRVATPPRGRRGPMELALTDASYGLGWRSFRYAGHVLVGHRGSVDGYSSLIMFDPVAKSGIVMLWNSNQSKAARLQLEFFDLLYGLPHTDWLELDAAEPAGDPETDTGQAHSAPAP